MLTRHPYIERLGSDAEARCEAYRRLLFAQLSETDLIKLRSACNSGVPLGSREFVRRLREMMQGAKKLAPRCYKGI